MRFKGKTVVITGAGSGTGRATAVLFAREGARVVCVDINERNGSQTAAGLVKEGNEAFFVRADVSKSEDVRGLAGECEQRVEKVDVLFNNAGRVIREAFEETSEETWFDMLGTNLTGVFLCSKYLLPLMKKAGAGAIINHASIDALLGNPQDAAYSAAKGGVVPLTHVMACDLARYKIRVNCLCTGAIDTAMTADSPVRGTRVAVTPLQRLGTPEEVAKSFFSSPQMILPMLPAQPLLLTAGGQE